jgi:hypothetical protein
VACITVTAEVVQTMIKDMRHAAPDAVWSLFENCRSFLSLIGTKSSATTGERIDSDCRCNRVAYWFQLRDELISGDL